VVTVDTLNVTGLNFLKIEKRKTIVTLLCVQRSSTSESTLLSRGSHAAPARPSSTSSIGTNMSIVHWWKSSPTDRGQPCTIAKPFTDNVIQNGPRLKPGLCSKRPQNNSRSHGWPNPIPPRRLTVIKDARTLKTPIRTSQEAKSSSSRKISRLMFCIIRIVRKVNIACCKMISFLILQQRVYL
jgi:hypothetical protein